MRLMLCAHTWPHHSAFVLMADNCTQACRWAQAWAAKTTACLSPQGSPWHGDIPPLASSSSANCPQGVRVNQEFTPVAFSLSFPTFFPSFLPPAGRNEGAGAGGRGGVATFSWLCAAIFWGDLKLKNSCVADISEKTLPGIGLILLVFAWRRVLRSWRPAGCLNPWSQTVTEATPWKGRGYLSPTTPSKYNPVTCGQGMFGH